MGHFLESFCESGNKWLLSWGFIFLHSGTFSPHKCNKKHPYCLMTNFMAYTQGEKMALLTQFLLSQKKDWRLRDYKSVLYRWGYNFFRSLIIFFLAFFFKYWSIFPVLFNSSNLSTKSFFLRSVLLMNTGAFPSLASSRFCFRSSFLASLSFATFFFSLAWFSCNDFKVRNNV